MNRFGNILGDFGFAPLLQALAAEVGNDAKRRMCSHSIPHVQFISDDPIYMYIRTCTRQTVGPLNLFENGLTTLRRLRGGGAAAGAARVAALGGGAGLRRDLWVHLARG
jgi:hypothetical protein